MWPLAWGLVMLRVANSEKIKEYMKPVLVILICLITFPSDWSCIASLWILAFGTKIAVVLAIPVLMMYNGKRGSSQSINSIMKWLFYIYYPLHFFVMGLIKVVY